MTYHYIIAFQDKLNNNNNNKKNPDFCSLIQNMLFEMNKEKKIYSVTLIMVYVFHRLSLKIAV